MKVKLIEMMPFFYKGVVTWYEPGQEFDVLESKEMITPKQIFYRLKVLGFELDGWVNSDAFIEEK
jgi:hypothetical protein